MAYQASKKLEVGAVRGGGEADIGKAAEHVGQHEFLGQAEQEDQRAVGEVVAVRGGSAPGAVSCGMISAGRTMGPAIRCGKESDEAGVGQQAAGSRSPPRGGVDQEHDLLEGEEADRQRQRDVQRWGRRRGDVQQEVGVFEPPQ